MTLLIFDCDGTLVDSELLHAEVEVDFLKEKFGLVVDATEHNRRFVGTGLAAVCAWIEQETQQPVPADFGEELSRRKNAAFRERLQPVPFIGETLNAIAAFPKCVASNTRLETVKISLQATKLDVWFSPHIFSAQMVARGKPAPDLFLYAAQQMNVAPDDCIVIEDSTHGVAAARAAKMRVFGYFGGGHCYPGYHERLQGAELLFVDMRDLPRLIEGA